MKFFPLSVLAFVSYTALAQTKTIVMSDKNTYQPSSITITPGTTVEWVNKSKVQHTSTSGTKCEQDGKWNSGNIDPGGTYSHKFESEGTFNFFCIPHCTVEYFYVFSAYHDANKNVFFNPLAIGYEINTGGQCH